MSKSNVKRVQTELDPREYRRLIQVTKQQGLTVKEALREALDEWTSKRIKLNPSDPLFNFSITFEGGEDSSKKIDEVLYRKEGGD